MTLHYHGTPITPTAQFLSMKGRCFCVSWFRADQLDLVVTLASSLMLDNGAFSRYTALRRELEKRRLAGEPMTDDEFYDLLNTPVDWSGYYDWTDPLLDDPNTWAVIPDVIDAGAQEQDALLRQWPHGRERGAPVWHMDEPIERLLRLLDEYPRVCIGSTGEYWRIWKDGAPGSVLDEAWESRMDETWEAVARRHKRTPNIHMLRGLAVLSQRWPFASGDATNVAQNHHRDQNTAEGLAMRIDSVQAPRRFKKSKDSNLLLPFS